MISGRVLMHSSQGPRDESPSGIDGESNSSTGNRSREGRRTGATMLGSSFAADDAD